MAPETNAAAVRLLLLDRDVLFRESLSNLLDAEPGFCVVGQCAGMDEAVAQLERAPADVLLVAWDGLGEPYDAVSRLRAAAPQAALLIIAARIDPPAALRALRLGISGIFLKDNSAYKLVSAVRIVAGGDAWIDRGLLQSVAAEAEGSPGTPFAALTERERKVLRAVVEGRTNRAIGEEVGASEAAIKRTLRNLFEKTGTHSRAALVRVALESPFGMRPDR